MVAAGGGLGSTIGCGVQRERGARRRLRRAGVSSLESVVALVALAVVGAAGLGALGAAQEDAIAGSAPAEESTSSGWGPVSQAGSLPTGPRPEPVAAVLAESPWGALDPVRNPDDGAPSLIPVRASHAPLEAVSSEGSAGARVRPVAGGGVDMNSTWELAELEQGSRPASCRGEEPRACLADAADGARRRIEDQITASMGSASRVDEEEAWRDESTAHFVEGTGAACRLLQDTRGPTACEDPDAWLRMLNQEPGTPRSIKEAALILLLESKGLDSSCDTVECLASLLAEALRYCDSEECIAFVERLFDARLRYIEAREDAPGTDLGPELDGDALPHEYVDGELFVDGISRDDVNQNGFGDCYLLAALAALAENHPEVIRRNIRDNGDGTFTVTFYDAQGRPIQVTVNAEISGTGAFTENGELWVALYEKAYAQLLESDYGGDFWGGWGAEDLVHLTGEVEVIRDADAGDVQKVREWLRQGQAVTVALFPDASTALGRALADRYRDKYPQGLPEAHMWYVVGVRDGRVVLGNPWGAGLEITLTAEEFDEMATEVTRVVP